jgi:PIN domain nuclease of toxin-antitoxin system
VVTYVLDTSAILRFLDNEAGAARIDKVISDFMDGNCRVAISAVNWGEVATKLLQKRGRRQFQEIFADLETFGFEIVEVTAARAVNCGLLKAEKKIPYADAFGVELTASIPGSVLITSDFDVKPMAHDIKIEFLPKKA